MADIGSLRPRLLIHGHTTLTEQFTAEAITGLQAALTQLHGQVLDGIRDGRTLPDILAGLRCTALHRLMGQYQQTDPFKFLIYAELAGAEIGPVQ